MHVGRQPLDESLGAVIWGLLASRRPQGKGSTLLKGDLPPFGRGCDLGGQDCALF